MKLTKETLKRIIKEELQNSIQEGETGSMADILDFPEWQKLADDVGSKLLQLGNFMEQRASVAAGDDMGFSFGEEASDSEVQSFYKMALARKKETQAIRDFLEADIFLNNKQTLMEFLQNKGL
jgi:hypothetical protein